MKSGKWHLTDGMEQPNQDKIKIFREMKTYKYSGILEADTIKNGGERKNLERLSQENQKAIRDKTMLQKPYQRNKYLGCIPRKIFGTILEVDQRRT